MRDKTEEKAFVVMFEGKGYYADHQPKYQWSYTTNLTKALHYKSKDKAITRCNDGLALFGGTAVVEEVTKRVVVESEKEVYTSADYYKEIAKKEADVAKGNELLERWALKKAKPPESCIQLLPPAPGEEEYWNAKMKETNGLSQN